VTPPRPARWPVIVAGAALQLLLLCAPVPLFGDPGRTLANPRVVVFLVLMTTWCAAEAGVQTNHDRPGASERPWLPAALGAALLLALWVSVVETAVHGHGSLGASNLVGAAAMSVGVALRATAIRTLGRYFLDEIATLPHQPLVTGGIYHRMRHPSEAGTLLLVFGAAVLLGSAAGGAAALLIVLPGVAWRIRAENAMLSRRYPDTFPGYSRSVPNLIPLLHA
jgi:protein-S-isoprenylcysteine O-methyltransferase Ste14